MSVTTTNGYVAYLFLYVILVVYRGGKGKNAKSASEENSWIIITSSR
jgi:hypothetical protein